MARPLRLEFSGAVYHLTSRGNARQKIFFTDADRELFLSTLSGVVRRYHWICHTEGPGLDLGNRLIYQDEAA